VEPVAVPRIGKTVTRILFPVCLLSVWSLAGCSDPHPSNARATIQAAPAPARDRHIALEGQPDFRDQLLE